MKTIKKSILLFCTIGVLILAGAGCGKANAQSGAGQSAQAPAAQSGTMGVITDVSGSSIIVAVMPQGNGAPQQPQGSGQPQGTGQPPQGGQPGGSGTQQPQMDTSGWEKKTFKIDASTKIVQGGSGGEAALKVSDLKSGENVAVTERSGASGTAGQIMVMQFGQGGPRGPGGQGGPAPQFTSKS